MLHFAGLGFDGVRSMSVIQWAARQAIGNSLAAADYAGRSFADGTLPQIAIKFPNKFTKAQGDELRDSFASTYNGPRGREISVGHNRRCGCQRAIDDAAGRLLIETRQFEKHDIYTAFGVPPIMGGDNEKTTSWGTGIRADHHRLCPLHAETAPCSLGRRAQPQAFPTSRAVCPIRDFRSAAGRPKAQTDYYKGRARWSGFRRAGCRSTKSGPCRTWRQSTARTNLSTLMQERPMQRNRLLNLLKANAQAEQNCAQKSRRSSTHLSV